MTDADDLWPFPSIGPAIYDGRAIIQQILDDPMSSAATSPLRVFVCAPSFFISYPLPNCCKVNLALCFLPRVFKFLVRLRDLADNQPVRNSEIKDLNVAF